MRKLWINPSLGFITQFTKNFCFISKSDYENWIWKINIKANTFLHILSFVLFDTKKIVGLFAMAKFLRNGGDGSKFWNLSVGPWPGDKHMKLNVWPIPKRMGFKCTNYNINNLQKSDISCSYMAREFMLTYWQKYGDAPFDAI